MNKDTSQITAILEHAAKVAREKQIEYGNTYDMEGAIMHILYPNGTAACTPDKHTRDGVLTWMIGKLCRYATATTYEAKADSLKDLIVYTAILYALLNKKFQQGENK